MAIVWGGWSGHMRVGVEMFTEATGTVNVINVIARFWVESDQWFNDNQTLHVTGTHTQNYDFTHTTGSGGGRQHVVDVRFNGQGQSPGGGPAYQFNGALSGVATGGTPSVAYEFMLPAQTVFPPVISTSVPQSITSSSVTINQAGIDERGAALQEVRVQLSVDSAFTALVRDVTGGLAPNFTGLARATGYYARSRGLNAAGWGGWSATASFTTLATVPDTPNLTISGVTATSATATTSVNNGGSHILEYQTQVSTNSAFSALHGTYNAAAANVTGLYRATTYWARTRARNAIGWSAWSATRSFTTAATVPAKMSAPVCTAQTATSLTFTFVAPSNNGGAAITGYLLELSESTGFATIVGTLTSSGGTITGLKPGTNYYARVRASNSVGDGVWSATTTAKTKPGVSVNINGVWRDAVPYVNVAGTWREAQPYTNVAGVWRQ